LNSNNLHAVTRNLCEAQDISLPAIQRILLIALPNCVLLVYGLFGQFPRHTIYSQAHHTFPNLLHIPRLTIYSYMSSIVYKAKYPQATRSSYGRELSLTTDAQESTIHLSFHERRSILASNNASSSSTSESPNVFKFWEFNRMRKIAKTTYNMDDYLKQRKGWIAVITEEGKSSTIRLDRLAEHMSNSRGRNIYTLVKPLYMDQYIQS
jgi:hypothetical protein